MLCFFRIIWGLFKFKFRYGFMRGQLRISLFPIWYLVCQVDEECVVGPVNTVEDHKNEGEQVHRHLVHILLEFLWLLIMHVFSNLSVDPRWLSLDTNTDINKNTLTKLTQRYNINNVEVIICLLLRLHKPQTRKILKTNLPSGVWGGSAGPLSLGPAPRSSRGWSPRPRAPDTAGLRDLRDGGRDLLGDLRGQGARPHTCTGSAPPSWENKG